MKVEIKFENEHELRRFATLLNGFHNQLLQIEYDYCCDDIINTDMALIDSVWHQLKEGK